VHHLHPMHAVDAMDPADIVRALGHCDTSDLARALAATDDPALTRLADALIAAADHRAAYPREDVIAEADALLYDVLRWPIADTSPDWEHAFTPASYAARTGVSLLDARGSLARLRDTEADAARALLAAGPIMNFTLEQAQVTACIASLMREGSAPTRALVRTRALETARAAIRPGDGDSPVVYSVDADLPPRIVSPSPKVHAALWLDRMDATPPPTGLIPDRITYLERAARLMGDAAREHARIVPLRDRWTPPFPAATPPAMSPARPAMGMVS
jgi:hypothetical protein